MKDFMAGAVLTALALFSIFWLIPNGIDGAGEEQNAALSPSFWPQAIAILILIFGLMLSAQAAFAMMLARKARLEVAGSASTATAQPKPSEKNWAVLVAVALLIPYYYLSMHAGLLIASVLAFTAYAFLAGERSYLSVACWAVVAPTAITVFFINVAQVLIPLGPLSNIF